MYNRIYLFSTLLVLILFAGCRNHDFIELSNYDNDDEEYDPSQVDLTTYPDWSMETHSNAAELAYDTVFAQNTVLRLDLTISYANWSSMWSDLSKNLSSSSSMGGFGNMGGGVTDLDFTPIWVPCTVTYNGTDWYQVGVRFKGNSSLSTAYSSGNQKLSLKLDFDEYEDVYPELNNQRFYGFKQLNLNNNYDDSSLMREKVASDLFREFGLASANTSFCTLYIDYGSGPEYFGVYTIVEEVDDTVIKTQFSQSTGNIYKPEEDAGSFKSGTYDTSEFNLKSNTSTADYSDVLALYNILHNSIRTSNSSEWQSQLEEIFNVDIFLKWLAANTTIQNWDTYGNMAHNYYLYNNPSDGLLTWIPWDNNESLQSGNSALSPTLTSSSSWPLISYLIAVDSYKTTYNNYMQEFIDDVFVVNDMTALYESYYNLLKEYADAEESGRTFLSSSYSFTSAVSTLKTHVQSRHTVVNNYLGN
ncbi:MAG: CotH kinase family protein [Bacteroidales bacterium]